MIVRAGERSEGLVIVIVYKYCVIVCREVDGEKGVSLSLFVGEGGSWVLMRACLGTVLCRST